MSDFNTPIRSMSSEELSHHLHEIGEMLVVAENQWFWVQEQKKIMLAEACLKYEKAGNGITKSQNMARASQSFKVHIQAMQQALENRERAKVRYKEIDFEVRRRLNLNFAKNREWNAGHTQT